MRRSVQSYRRRYALGINALLGREVASQYRRDERRRGALALGASDVDGVEGVEFGGLDLQSEERTTNIIRGTAPHLTVFPPTSCPMRCTHDSISGIAREFFVGPAFLRASTIEKLVCRPLSAATAAL